MNETVEVVVIGAGPAGLAAAAMLRERGIDAVILDQAPTVGDRWRHHYDRLHLHTASRHSGLPGLPWPASAPKFPSRDEVVAYLERYAAHFQLQPRLGHTVVRAAPSSGGWHIVGTGIGGAPFSLDARFLVVATGYNRVARPVSFPGIAGFPGTVCHGGAYRNGEYARGQRALVVGCGNSGAEMALDLVEHGAAVWLVVRNPTWVVPRDLLALSSQEWSILLSGLPTSWYDQISRFLLGIRVGDLSRYGIQRPVEGPRDQIERLGRVPLLDIGTLARIRSGEIRVVPGVERFEGAEAIFSDGQRLPFDHVVVATGYSAALDGFLAADFPRNERGLPVHHGEEAGVPGLYFTGFKNPPTGAFRELGFEAPRIAADIGRRRVKAQRA